MPPSSRRHGLRDRLADLPLGAIPVIALASAIAPFVVQTATFVLTRSSAATLLVGAALASSFVAVAFAWQAQMAGALRAVPRLTLAGTALAILVYHFIAFPVARVLGATLFATDG